MKILALTVLLAVMQTSPPVPRKTADPSNRASQNVKNDSTDNQTPPQQSHTIVQPITANPDQNGSHRPATENAQNPIVVRELPPVSVTKDWWDRIYITFTGILIVVGIIGVRAAYKTLGEMKAQRVAMQGQLTAMQGQLSQMESAGKQTDKLIKHASDQAIALTDAANAASSNALAAKQAVEIVISKERFRIAVIPWGRLQLPWLSHPVTHEAMFADRVPQTANYDMHFYGLTEGYISEAVAGACLSNSEDVPKVSASPIRDLPKRILATEQKELAKAARLLPGLESMDDVIAVVEGRKFIHCWGTIRYRDAFYDVFLQERETAFRWVWKFTDDPADLTIGTPLGGRFGNWQKCGPPEDNRET